MAAPDIQTHGTPFHLTTILRWIKDALPSGRNLPDAVWQVRHRWLTILLAVHAIGVAGFGIVMGGSQMFSILAGAVLAGFATIASLDRIGQTTRTALVTAGLMGAGALLVHLSGGYIELHFHFFVLLAFIAIYQNWVPFTLALGLIVLHHGIVGTVWPSLVYNHPDAILHPWKWSAIHGGGILTESIGLLMYWRFNELASAQTQASDAQFRQVVESAPNGILMVRQDGAIMLANTQIEQLFGYTRQELIGQPVEQLIPERFRPHHPVLRNEFFQSPSTLAMGSRRDLFGRRKNGSEFPIELGLSPIETPEGLQVLASVIDITARKHTELSLRNTEERIRLMIEEITDYAIISLDREGRIASWNNGARRLKLYEETEIIGRHFSCFYTQEDAGENLPARILQQASHHGRMEDEGWRVRKDGSRFWANVVVTALHDRKGKLQGFSKVTRDMTARKNAERAVEESRAHLQAVLDAATEVSIIATDLQGVITLFNKGAERLLGHRADDMVGKSTPAIFHLEEEVAAYGALLTSQFGRPIEGFNVFTERASRYDADEQEWTYLCKDGSRRTVNLVMTAQRNHRGAVTGYLGIATDITDRKLTELQLAKAAQDMENRNLELATANDQAMAATKAKSAFLAAMSHEIRTPMNAIIGMADLLQETALTLDQQEYVQRFNRAASSLLDLLNDILDISKIESGHLDLETVSFDLTDLIDKTMELMAVRAQAKHIELLSFIHPDVPSSLIGDPVRLRQVLVNLLGNAIKFTERGDVSLRIEPDEHAPDAIRCSVSDQGIGIPADKLGGIFDSFTQVDSSTTRKYGGTGLGLSISKQLVELMGGHIEVSSTAGAGSTFSFVIRLAPATDHLDEPQPSLTIEGRRILVVDDNDTNRLIIRQYLGQAGAHVVETANSIDALAALEEARRSNDPFALAILDYRMPGMNGLDLAQAIRRQPDTALLPLILHMSEMRSDINQRMQLLGRVHCVYKPTSRKRLIAAAAAALGLAPAMPAPKSDAPPCQPAATIPPLRILLAEDLEDNRDIIKLFVKDTPCRIDMAENGLLALRAFQSCAYDLVLMDMQMPVMDGYQATAAIRQWEQEHRRPPTPILALTANAFQEDITKSLAAGCTAHISKPIKKKTLLTAIVEHTRDSPLAAA